MSRKTELWSDIRRLVVADIHQPYSRTRYSGRRVSEKTIRDRWAFYKSIPGTLHDAGYKLRKMRNFDHRHLEAMFSDWDRRRLCGSTVKNHVYKLRRLLERADKSYLLPRIDEYVAKRQSPMPGPGQGVAQDRGRSWSASGVDISELIQRVYARDSLVALQLCLQAELGLRVREAFRLRPDADWQGEQLKVIRGPKGGRPRELSLTRPEQHRLLAHARQVAQAIGRNGSLMPQGYSESRWRSYYYWVLHRCGVTRKGAGVTSHGLRHEYAQRRYEALSGQPAPVRAGGSRQRDGLGGEADAAARNQVARDLGHGRYDITSTYLDLTKKSGVLRHVTTRRGRNTH